MQGIKDELECKIKWERKSGKIILVIMNLVQTKLIDKKGQKYLGIEML